MQEVNMEDVLDHLKAVFEACDQNGDGFVKTQDLLRLGQEHSSDGFEVQFVSFIEFYKIMLWVINTTIDLWANRSLTGVKGSGVDGCFDNCPCFEKADAVPKSQNPSIHFMFPSY